MNHSSLTRQDGAELDFRAPGHAEQEDVAGLSSGEVDLGEVPPRRREQRLCPPISPEAALLVPNNDCRLDRFGMDILIRHRRDLPVMCYLNRFGMGTPQAHR